MWLNIICGYVVMMSFVIFCIFIIVKKVVKVLVLTFWPWKFPRKWQPFKKGWWNVFVYTHSLKAENHSFPTVYGMAMDIANLLCPPCDTMCAGYSGRRRHGPSQMSREKCKKVLEDGRISVKKTNTPGCSGRTPTSVPRYPMLESRIAKQFRD